MAMEAFFITYGNVNGSAKHAVCKVLDAMMVAKIEAVQAGSDNKPKLPVLFAARQVAFSVKVYFLSRA